jgi:hypothetical protein
VLRDIPELRVVREPPVRVLLFVTATHRTRQEQIMGIRLSIGSGPLAAGLPLASRRRQRRSRAAVSGRLPSFRGIARFTDGSVYTCQHAHGTPDAAAACAARYKRDLAAGRPLPPRAMLRRT